MSDVNRPRLFTGARDVWRQPRPDGPEGNVITRGEIRLLVGHTITAAVYARRIDPRRQPQCQLFLVFENDRYIELWTPHDPILLTKGLDPGGLRAALHSLHPPASVRLVTPSGEWRLVKDLRRR